LLAVLKQIDETGIRAAGLADEEQIATALEEVTVECRFFGEF
jgi:hypothetical protein